MKFRKKPIIIDAIQWTGERGNLLKITTFIDGSRVLEKQGNCIIIQTLEGDMKANLKDWIIKGVNGECYPCKPNIFLKTYERLN